MNRQITSKYLSSQGFTLIELLVVMAIIAALSALIIPMVTIGKGVGEKQETIALLQKVASAIDLFQHETGAPPLPSGSKADPLSGTWYPSQVAGTWEKQQLWWRLSAAMTLEDKIAMREAGESKSLELDPYQSDEYIKSKYGGPAAQRARVDEIMATIPDEEANAYKGTYAKSDWASGSDAKPSGNKSQYWGLTYRGRYKSYILASRAAIGKDIEERKFISYPCLDMEDIGEEFIADQSLVDSWGQPLIYVSTFTRAFKERRATGGNSGMRYFGFPESGRLTMTDRNGDGIVDEGDWSVLPTDASDLVDRNEDTFVDIKDWGNVLYYARPGSEKSYFLSSAGPDMLFNCVLSSDENIDNVNLKVKE